MKIVHGNAVFIREEARLARNTHRYYVSLAGPTPFPFIILPREGGKEGQLVCSFVLFPWIYGEPYFPCIAYVTRFEHLTPSPQTEITETLYHG